MGREIRRVPPNWEHPQSEKTFFKPGFGYVTETRYSPMHDQDFNEAMTEWIAGAELWLKGEHEYQGGDEPRTYAGFAEFWSHPPDPEYCRPVFEVEPTWFQVYETVSEGTPVSPPFETPEELARYLSENGDFWEQSRASEGSGWGKPTYEQALAFVTDGCAPSMMVRVTAESVQVANPYTAHELTET